MSAIRKIVRSIVPGWVLAMRQRRIARRTDAAMAGKSPREVFSEIYADGRWGRGDDGFSSGEGSETAAIVDPYVEAVGGFLRGFAAPPDVVDLGCGDFAVGRRLRPDCGRYIACDIVPALIDRNRQRFATLDVDFRCIDMIADPLPEGQVAFIRQVFQHLGNEQIARVLPKLRSFDHLVVTEHVPDGHFTPNMDKAAGPGIRIYQGSGVDLEAPPFSLQPAEARVICSVPSQGGVVRTVVYRLR